MLMSMSCFPATSAGRFTLRRLRMWQRLGTSTWICAFSALALATAAIAQPHDPNTRHKVELVGTEPQLGPSDAAVTLIEFGGFQDPFSARVAPTLKELSKRYGEDLRIVWLNNPLPFHQYGLPAANAALEAQAQEGNAGFWAMHGKLLSNQSALNRPSLEKYAREIGLDVTKFKQALDEGRHIPTIQRQQALARQVGAKGTPNFFINGRNSVRGAVPIEQFVAAIDKELAQAKGVASNRTPRAEIAAPGIAAADSTKVATGAPNKTTSESPTLDTPSAAAPVLTAQAKGHLKSLPTPAEVLRQNLYPTPTVQLDRQVAALWALMDYVLVVTELPLESVRGVPEWAQYDAAQKKLRKQAARSVRFAVLYESEDFRKEVIGRLPSADQDAYWAERWSTRPLDPAIVNPTTAPPKPPVDDGRYKRQKELARKRGIDLDVFGIKLYEPLNLPVCPKTTGEDGLLGWLFGVGVGADTMCVAPGALRTTFEFASLVGKVGAVESPLVRVVPVVLEGKKCPDWVRFSGTCMVFPKLLDGYVVAVNIRVVGPGNEKTVAMPLSAKYKQKPAAMDAGYACVHENGKLAYETQNLAWRLNGLRIEFRPMVEKLFNANCLERPFGIVFIETPEYRRILPM